jgi:putative Mg2+ transporter-C (MgtC) family protein
MNGFFSVDDINLSNAIFRLIAAFIAGGMIGINREKYNRAAGFRTHILICLGSCLLMLISIFIPQEFMNFKNGDPGRIAAQVVTGIGFLGAGAIIKLGDHVKGLTTAASIWVSAAIGLAIGAGMIYIAAVTVLFVLLALILMERLERMLFNKRNFKTLIIKLKQTTVNTEIIEDILKSQKVKFTIQEIQHNSYIGIIYLEIAITVDAHFSFEKFMGAFSSVPNLQEISVKNKV